MTRDQIIATASAEDGTNETPIASNKTKYGKWYGMDGVPWCAIFVSWVYHHAGFPLGYIDSEKGYHYCRSAYNYWRSSGVLTNTPQKGDIVLFDWDGDGISDHTGIFLEWVDEQQNVFRSWEGNTAYDNDSDGGKVMLRERAIEVVWAFVSPNVLGETSTHVADTDLRKGTRGAQVAHMQKKLYDLGYDIVVDGHFGTHTYTQVRLFQKEHKLNVTGIVNALILGAIDNELAYKKQALAKISTGSFIRKGNSGAVVVLLQRALNRAGASPQLAVDGVFGTAMFRSVKAFQQKEGLKVDGIAGPQTIQALGIH